MTRRLAKLAGVCVLLGLVTTVFVAWSLAVFLPMQAAHQAWLDLPGNSRAVDGGHDRLSVRVYSRFGSARRMWYQDSYRDFLYNRMSTASWAIQTPASESTITFVWSVGGPHSWGRLGAALETFAAGDRPEPGLEDGRGWPALALSTRFEGFDPYTEGGISVRDGIALAPAEGVRFRGRPANADIATVRALPMRPIWPGLAFNTAFYALLWWLAFVVTRLVKHNRRYRRGLCPACRYDLRADYSAGCSECGWER